MTNKDKLKELIQAYYRDTSNLSIKAELQLILSDKENLKILDELWQEGIYIEDSLQTNADDLYHNIKKDERIAFSKMHTISTKVKKVVVLAAILLLGLFVSYYWLVQPNVDNSVDNKIVENTPSIIPGTHKAKIVLQDGHIIDLEKLYSDTSIYEKGYIIHINTLGKITYESVAANSLNKNTIYNTITTPRGGEYNLQLPDGTQVWLNALTTLKYPVNFEFDTREVSLDGEAYFEVAKLERKGQRVPFILTMGKQKLEVLGTAFNIKRFGDKIETTLIEGSVKLNYKDINKINHILTPSQQMIYHEKLNTFKKNTIDTFYATAWREGKFAFYKTPIHEAMASICSWYDVEVFFNENLDDYKISGSISRYEDFNKLLSLVELASGLKIKRKERSVYVSK